MKRFALVAMLSVAVCLFVLGGHASPATAKDSIVVSVTAEILTLNNHKSAGSPSEIVRRHIYEGLTEADEKNQIHPKLAEKWEISKDKLVWTFHLRKDVKFQDGTPFNATAVKKNFDKLLDPNSQATRRYLFTFIKKIETVDDYTVRFHTETPQANFLYLLAYGGGHMTSPAFMEKAGANLDKTTCGTGPYKLKNLASGGASAVVERFDGYWGKKPAIKEIKFVSVPEEATRVTMLEAGEADFITGVSPVDVARLKGDSRFVIRTDRSNRVAHIGLNLKKKPFDEKLVRQALNYAVNREQIVKGVMAGAAEPFNGYIAPATWGSAKVVGPDYNPEKAKTLLKEAGLASGFSAKLWTPQGRYFRDKETALAVAGQLKKIGANLSVEVVDWGQYLKELRIAPDQSKFETYFLGWESSTGEASYLLDSLFTTDSQAPKGWNTMYYSNPKLDRLSRLASSEMREKERLEYMKNAQQILVDDAIWIPLYVYSQISVHTKGLSGMSVLPLECPLFMNAAFK